MGSIHGTSYLLLFVVIVTYISEGEAKVINSGKKWRSNITDEVGVTRVWHDDTTNICTKLVDELPGIRDKHKRGKFKEEEMVQVIVDGCKNGYKEDDRKFPFQLMKKLSGINLLLRGENFGKEKASWVEFEKNDEDTNDFDAYKRIKRFSLRHYTKPEKGGRPTYDTVQSNFAQVVNEIKEGDNKKDEKKNKELKGGNTKIVDYTAIGNPAFTFWLFCVDGKVPKREFLKNYPYYTEIPLDKESLKQLKLNDVEFYGSNDLLSLTNYLDEIEPKLVRGTLENLVPLVLKKEVRFGRKIFKKEISVQEATESLDAIKILSAIEELFIIPAMPRKHLAEFKIPGTIGNVKWHATDDKDIVEISVILPVDIDSDSDDSEDPYSDIKSKLKKFRHGEKNSSNGTVSNSHKFGEKWEMKGVLKH